MLALQGYYDSEEVGSGTKQGAGSVIIRNIIDRIFRKFGYDEETAECALADAVGLSVDVAHGIHPNIPEKNVLTNSTPKMDQVHILRPFLN